MSKIILGFTIKKFDNAQMIKSDDKDQSNKDSNRKSYMSFLPIIPLVLYLL
jgi:hypothetical protein